MRAPLTEIPTLVMQVVLLFSFLLSVNLAVAHTFVDCLEMGVPRQLCLDAVVGLPPDSEAATKALDAVIEDHLHPKHDWPYGALPERF